MAKKVIFNDQDFTRLDTFFKSLDFRVMKDSDWQFAQTTKNLKPPRKQEGEEVSYCYDANGYRVVVQTTFNTETKSVFKSDSGWVLIIDIATGNRVWSSYPFRRTKGFLEKIKTFGELMQKEVDQRPVCSCKVPMKLIKAKEFKSYLWVCPKVEYHHGEELPKNFLYRSKNRKQEDFLRKFEKRKDNYLLWLDNLGLAPGRAKRKRKSW